MIVAQSSLSWNSLVLCLFLMYLLCKIDLYPAKVCPLLDSIVIGFNILTFFPLSFESYCFFNDTRF